MFNLYNLISKIFNCDKDEPIVEDFDEITRKLFRLRRINANYVANNKKNESKFLKSEITKLNKDLKISLKENDRKFKLLSNKDGVIIWGHPDDPYNKTKQIKYYLQKDGSYSVSAEKNSNAYIISDDAVIDINNGYQNLYGGEKQFKLTANEKSKILFRESRKRFNDYFSNQNVILTRPFFLNSDQKKLLTYLKSSDKKMKENAINHLLSIAKNNDNCFVPTYNNVPYYDKSGNIIFGFDDDRTSERYFGRAGSKYSIAYKISSNNPDRFEIIASDFTCDCYVMVIDKSDPNKEYFEILNIGNNPQNYKFSTSDNQTAKFIDYNLAKNIDCPSLCALIRTQSKNPGTYGINIYDKTQKLLKDIEAYMLLKNYSEDHIRSVKENLYKAMNFKEGYNILKIFSSDEDMEDFINKIINQINSDQNIDNLKSCFIKFVKSYGNYKFSGEKKVVNFEKPQALKGKTRITNKVFIDSDYEVIASFEDSKCGNQPNNFNGKVFLCNKKEQAFDCMTNNNSSFILEVKDNEVSIRLGIAGNYIRNTVINILHDGKKYQARIQDDKILYRNKTDKTEFSEEIIYPFKKASNYSCGGCINYDNKDKIIHAKSNYRNLNIATPAV